MRVTKVLIKPTQVKLAILANTEDLAPVKRHVLQHLSSQVRVPGFRSGKAPLNLVEKYTDQRLLLDEFVEHALNTFYGRALDQEKLRPVAAPQIQVKKFVPFTQLDFEAEIEIIGTINLPDYKAIRLARKTVAVSAEDIDGVIKSLQQRNAERIEVERGAKNGDELLIDFSGKDQKGKPVNGASGKDYLLILGSNTFIPGFEEHLIGVKTGEKKKFTIVFPKDYGIKTLQGKKVVFMVDIKKVSKLKETEIDDVFASQVGPFKTVTELKADIKKQLTAERQFQADREYENELIKSIADKTEVEIPGIMVDEHVQRMEEEEKRNIMYRNQTWQEHLEAEGLTEEEHRARQRPMAEERIRGGLALSEIADKENIQVTPKEVEIRIQNLKEQYKDQAMQAELDNPENRRDIIARLLTEKTVAKVVEYATK